MSHNRGVRSKEEREVQNVLSPGSQSTISGDFDRDQNIITLTESRQNPNALQATSIASNAPKASCSTSNAPKASISKELEAISQTFSDTLVNTLTAFGFARNDELEEYDDDEYYDEDDYEGIEHVQELPTGRPTHSDEIFGTDINEHPIDDNNNNLANSNVPKTNVNFSNVPITNVNLPNTVNPIPVSPVVEPDKTLPLPLTSRAPTNWHPDPSVMAWATNTVDSCEWTDVDRLFFEKLFSPEKQYDHLFTAVAPPNGMSQAMQAPETKKRDYLFQRAVCEDHLLQANKDIVCGFRPLLEVISNLKNDPNQSENRTLLARVFQSMASSNIHLSRGRRELGRRFVNLSNAEALFNKPPSHHTFFGSSSVDSAVTQAVANSKINKDLIVMPRKRKYFPSRSYHPGGKSAFNYNSSRGAHSFRNHPYRYENFRSRGRGRGRSSRRGRSRPQQQKSDSKTSAAQ